MTCQRVATPSETQNIQDTIPWRHRCLCVATHHRSDHAVTAMWSCNVAEDSVTVPAAVYLRTRCHGLPALPRSSFACSYVGHILGKPVYWLHSASIFWVKGKVVPVHVIQACSGRAGIAPLTFNFAGRSASSPGHVKPSSRAPCIQSVGPTAVWAF
jgi:hypothetical protein